MTVVGNNHLLPQASLAPNQKGARAAPQADPNRTRRTHEVPFIAG